MNTTNMDKQDDKQERVIPKLRFPEFQTTLGWDRDILGDLFAERSKKNNPEKTVLAATQDKGVIPYELMDKSVIRDRKNLGCRKISLSACAHLKVVLSIPNMKELFHPLT